ncbi:TIGR02679 domain-containing protein, partial [Streptomyces sp. BE133]|nr:TIGR02679 domain-containing protein [Streptomyces sp. BE133]
MSGPPVCPEQWCPQGACHEARFDSLLLPDARWLWEQLAERADRRDDACLSTGTALIAAPAASAQRAAVQGLVGTVPLAPGARRSIRLEDLTRRLQRHGPRLTPGAVAAHAVKRPLGGSRLERARQAARVQQLRKLRARLAAELPAHAPVRPVDQSWEALHRTGRVTRILRHPAPEQLLHAAAEVLRRLPAEGRIDRRVLAERVTGDPHGLDAGTELGSLVLAEITAAGLSVSGTPQRVAWGEAGVALDSLGGGLLRGRSVCMRDNSWIVPSYGCFAGCSFRKVRDHRDSDHALGVGGLGL